MKIGIIGLGLIGGSLGIDLRSRSGGVASSQEHYIIGISRHEDTCKIALDKGIVDRASQDFTALSDAEVVIVCSPIAAISSLVEQIIPYLNPDTIITDVGSVKYPVVKSCSKLWSRFIGGHPMAGTSSSGINAAIPNLFTGAAYVFTPTDKNNAEDVAKLKKIALDLGAIPYICDAKIHDRAVSSISHLPVMISASLIRTCLQEESNTLDLAQILASSGFRDTSRVGGGNAELGVMMAKYNRQELLRSLYSYRDNLDSIIDLIKQEKWQDLEDILKSNGEARPKFLN